jgi:iron complex outermembrane receptor protein
MLRVQRKHLLLGSSLLALASIATAHAQSAPPPPVVQNTGLKPVVITARHRAERVQSVPVSVTVVDASQIKTVGSSNLNKLQQLVPSLTIDSFNPRNTALNIRGLGSVPNLANDGLEGGVGTYVDGVLLARPAEDVFDLPDIQDIEVLRGPQGTLFGKNTVSGAVNITTKLPSFTPEADGSVSYGTQNYVQLKASASSAVFGSDKVAFGIAFEGTQHNGYVKNTANGEHYGNQDDEGVRAQVLYNATPNLTIRAIYDYSHQHENCCVNQPVGLVTNYDNGAAVPNNKNLAYLDALLGTPLQLNNAFKRENEVDSPVYYDMETGGATLIADYDLDSYNISSITGFRYWNWYPHNDSDDTALPIVNVAYTDYQRQFSQELRLTSPLGGRVDYTGGLYFFYQDINGQNLTAYGADAGQLYAAGAAGAAPGSATSNLFARVLDGLDGVQNIVYDTRSFAGYGQAVFHATSKFDITAGLRETYENKTGSFNETQQGGTALSPGLAQTYRNAFVPVQQYGRGVDTALPAGLLTLSYKVSPNILTYATYSHGAKSAGLNLFAITAANSAFPTVVKPETIDNYEAGIKTTLLDNRLQLDGDVFWDEDTNYQATFIAQTGSSLFTYVGSVPKVRSRGAEIDARAQPTDNLNLFFSGVYDDAYNESDKKGICPIELSNTGANCNQTGEPVAGNSTWVGSFGGEYDQPLPELNGRNLIAYAGGNVELKSGFYSGSDDSKYGFVPGYGIGNVDFGVKSGDGRWDLSGWVHNVTDTHYYLYRGASNTAAFPTYNLIYAQVGDPISGGVTLSGKF